MSVIIINIDVYSINIHLIKLLHQDGMDFLVREWDEFKNTHSQESIISAEPSLVLRRSKLNFPVLHWYSGEALAREHKLWKNESGNFLSLVKRLRGCNIHIIRFVNFNTARRHLWTSKDHRQARCGNGDEKNPPVDYHYWFDTLEGVCQKVRPVYCRFSLEKF